MRTHPTSLRLTSATLVLVFLISTAGTARAQTREAERPLTTAALAASTTAVASQSGRRADPLWNGALIGAGVAVAGGLFLCTRTEPWENCRDDYGPMLRIGALGAGIGIAIDALIRSKASPATAVTSGVRAAPIVGRRTRGLQVSIGF